RAGTAGETSPSGRFTWTRPGESATATPLGRGMGWRPIRLIALPDEGDDLAADALLLRRATRHDPSGRGQDRDAHTAEHARHAVLARVDPAAGLRDALQVADHALAAAAVLELDHERVVRRLGLALDMEVADVAL